MAERIIKEPSQRISLIFCIIALHSLTVGLVLILQPSAVLDAFGYDTANEKFFSIQGGVFHILMVMLYVPVALNPGRFDLLIYFSIIVKCTAFIFLLSYYFFIDRNFIVLLSGIVDGAMALAIILANRSYRKQKMKILKTIGGKF